MAEILKPRKPDYKLKVMDKTNKNTGAIGVGWMNQDGSISLRINPGTFLHYNPNLAIMLFPNDSEGFDPTAATEVNPF